MTGTEVRQVMASVIWHGDEAVAMYGGSEAPLGELALWLYTEVGVPTGKFRNFSDRVDQMVTMGLRKGYSKFRPNLIDAIGVKP